MLVSVITAIAPILVALIAIIPTIKSNRKKTETTFEEALKKTQTSIAEGTKATDQRIDKIQTTLDNHIRENEDDNARNRRTRILRFYDEMCEGRKHSENHFEDILDDIDEYEKYCDAHPTYRNNRGHIAMEYIKTTYDKLKAKGGFLVHKED